MKICKFCLHMVINFSLSLLSEHCNSEKLPLHAVCMSTIKLQSDCLFRWFANAKEPEMYITVDY